ncbi:securin [Stegostoma tigrinum]|uniref:securin n=1 Tax=Stegostoma tigrinum TaxID=3053191 RepID=UPI00202B4652|nr:securin [Stegostoma tigrinum]XP_048399521.1 securin [Stegostoma tigrinum]XP_048399522.1 securin [Stegostoma tigrinum]XP_048399523.1 securin [Stegostoma tigrinum]XP_048399524.1 securin [Stegostoma tigrinum]
MAVRIFVEKENELLGNYTKNYPKLFSGSATVENSVLQTPRTGKVLTTTPRLQPSARKALGDVNCPLRAGSIPGHLLNKKPDRSHKRKNNAWIIKAAKPSENSSNLEPPKCSEKSEDYPEMETFIPYNPLDFEEFNVPKEHKLDHTCLAGLPLLFLEKEEALIEKVLNKIPSPPNWPSLVQESSLFDFDMHADILADLDEVELPTIEDDFL